MNNLNYILEINVLLILSWLIYLMILKNGKHFKWNRIYLLLSVIISLILPFISFENIYTASIQLSTFNFNSFSESTIDFIDKPTNSLIGVSDIISTIYLTGVFLMTVKLLSSVIKTIKILGVQKFEKQEHLFFSFSQDYTFSFFNFIVINNKHKNNLEVINHEIVHAKQKHSFDILFIEFLKVLFWFNPIVYYLKKEIEINHEFIADSKVVNFTNISSYLKTMVNESYGNQIYITHSFYNHKTLKRRIMMIKKNKNETRAITAIIFSGLILSSTFFIAGCAKPEGNNSIENNFSEEILEDKITQAEFPGGQQAMMQFLGSEIKYPKGMKESGQAGTVYVKFRIDETGKIIDSEILKGVTDEFDNEALRVVNMMPNWIPGEKNGKKIKMEYTLPIKFALE